MSDVASTSAIHSSARPLRLKVRKLEPLHLAAVAAGRKTKELCQQPYLASSKAGGGWSLGWPAAQERVGELWVGLSPVGALQLTHFARLVRCEKLEGIRCWQDAVGVDGAAQSAVSCSNFCG